ncbi:SDR family NAD(P)-dependent oxidoreductase [Plantactinospora endophytica]|uniref:Dehydrogenase n=1 Tax=Plantactinospora endophytica TaxID=673535 RepID=A0ABQ4EB93_9ACTN|nr:SDR family oxidoreductase [Plantactinospora endophytica]GIG92005.1 dehydrogenase [Plantactinospora endophytica]
MSTARDRPANLLPGATELTGQVAIVTGGAIGIGRAIAEDLGSAGAKVVVADRAGAAETAVELRAVGIDALGLPVDVSSEAATRELAAEVLRAYGGIDILVNNAGIFTTLRPGPLEEIDVAEWQRVMDVNVLGSYLCIRAVVGPMRDRGGGRIVNIASTTAFKGVAHLLHYVASKGAVIAMTRATARELGDDNILVNAVAPGFTVSDGILDGGADLAELRRAAPGKRVLAREQRPRDVVGAVRFLAGPMSSFVTGQTVVVDGGAFFH